MNIEDAIHQFLLNHGYTRASIISQPAELPISGTRARSHRPAFAVMNPETGSILAVLDIAHNESSQQLATRANRTAAYANELDSPALQGYVVNVRSNDEGNRSVNFVQVFPGDEHRVVTTQRFPDLETLVVYEQLAQQEAELEEPPAAAEPQLVDDELFGLEPEARREPRFDFSGANALHLLGTVLLLLAVIDLVIARLSGSGLFSLQQTVFLVTGASIFALTLLAGLLTRQASNSETTPG